MSQEKHREEHRGLHGRRLTRRLTREPSAGIAAPPLSAHNVCKIIQHLRLAGAFGETGLSIDIDLFGSAIVHCNGAYRGAWHWDGQAFAWIPSGYNQPERRVRTPQEAAYRTVQMALSTQSFARERGVRVSQIAVALGIASASDNDNDCQDQPAEDKP